MLRGTGAAMALPWLESMTSAATTDGAALAEPPLRSIFMYMPNGVRPDYWTPAGDGESYEITPHLKPLEALKNDFSLPQRGQLPASLPRRFRQGEESIEGRCGHRSTQVVGAVRSEFLIRVEDQHPVAGGLFQGAIAGRTEIVAPGELMDFGAVLAGDLHRAIGGTRVHHHDLVSEVSHRAKALPEELLFVFHDQADTQSGVRRSRQRSEVDCARRFSRRRHPSQLPSGFPMRREGVNALEAVPRGGPVAELRCQLGEEQIRLRMARAFGQRGKSRVPGRNELAVLEQFPRFAQMAQLRDFRQFNACR